MSEHVRVRAEAGVLRLTLARAEKKNALTNAMYATLATALEHAESDPQIRVVLLDAEGDAFTAGNDLDDFAAVASGTASREEMTAHLFLRALSQARKPCVAAVQGLAVGIGTTMLMHFDMVFAAEDARLSTPFVNLGLVPEAASSRLLPARIGYARAFAMVALGESIDGRTAAAIGLITAALPAAQVGAKAWLAAKALAARPPAALQATKQLMRDTAEIWAVMERERSVFSERLQSAEAAEAFRAFRQRRAPNFDLQLKSAKPPPASD